MWRNTSNGMQRAGILHKSYVIASVPREAIPCGIEETAHLHWYGSPALAGGARVSRTVPGVSSGFCPPRSDIISL